MYAVKIVFGLLGKSRRIENRAQSALGWVLSC